MKNIRAVIIGIFTVFIIGAGLANAANWTVTKASNSDDNVCDADCSLREAVFNADSGDTVLFSPTLIGQTLTLGGSEIVITKRIAINGDIDGVNVAFISGAGTSRIFHLVADAALTLTNATLVQGNGKPNNADPGVSEGGAIYAVNATLSMERVSFRANSAKFSGAVSFFQGTHRITNCSFSSNSAETNTAFAAAAGASVYMSNTTISRNFNFVGDNDTIKRGAIALQGGHLYVRNSTITENSGGFGGGIAHVPGPISTLDIGNTIVGENTADITAPDIYWVLGLNIISRGGNLIGNTDTVPVGTFTQPSDIVGVNPLLGPTNASLGGFPVISHPLQAGSPARNGGLNANAVDPFTGLPLTTDTRGAGFSRIEDSTVDIGAYEDASGNTSLIVTKKTNSNDLVCDTDCSLREAVSQASINFGTETITFAANVFGTLDLGGTEILINNQNVNIIGYPGLTAETLIVSGDNAHRVFHLNNATVSMSGLAVANGNAGAGFGGGILSENGSNLTLDRVIVRNNFAAAYGGIYLSGGTGRIKNTTINNNSANTGLAIGISGTMNMANATVSGNFDADGGTGIGAIFVTGTANIRNSTIAFNRTSGGTGAGIFNAGTLNIGNTIVSNNIALTSPDVHQSGGTITSVGGNLVQDTNGFPGGTFSQTNDVVNIDPQLTALGSNSGSVTTHLLMPTSLAINTGINAVAVDPFDNSVLATDARGFNRIVSIVDKGAVESLVPTAANVSISGRILSGKQGVRNAQVILTDQEGNQRTFVSGTFGNYRFDDLEIGKTYVIHVVAKRYQFNSQVVTLQEDLTEFNFSAESETR